MKDFFNKLKVLELASVLAGPSVGQFFAELGAEVIKVESAQGNGDVTRSWKATGENTDDRSAYFCAVNWGKRSIALDLTQTRDREIVNRLAKRSDIVITSYKPGDAGKLGVSYEQLCRINPKIIYGEITGYGPGINRVGYDAVLQAETGFMFMNGEPGGKHLKMPVALIDVLAAHQLTGQGQRVAVSLFDTAISSLVNQATNYLMNGKIPQKQGSAHPNIAPYGDVFYTKDNVPILLAIGSDKQFRALCVVLNRPEIVHDQRFTTNPLRVVNRGELAVNLQDAIKNINSGDLMDQLIKLNIPAGTVRNLKEVFASSGPSSLILQQDFLKGIRTYVGNNGSVPTHQLAPPPRLGEHTQEILAELDR
jgi:crotonobetainyl-CoA:carnitine CoA-transferase CaiB-like acyl-CoA transferase